VGVLSLATLLSYIDRQLINLLVDPVRSDLGLTDTEMSVLQGPAFIVFYLLVGLPAGRLADTGNRRNIIIAGLLIWSVMTMLCGLASSFWELFAARAGVGIGEACLAPAAYSLIADYVPDRLRGRAMSLVALSAPLGSGLSFILGGAMLAAFPKAGPVPVPLIGDLEGWQACFLAAGLPGFAVAARLLFVREVPRREAKTREGERPMSLLAALKGQWRLLVPFFLTIGLLALAAYAITAWKASYYIRELGLSPQQAGIALGLVGIFGNIVGGGLGGWLSDRFARSGRRSGRAGTLVISALLSVPMVVLWLNIESIAWSLAGLAIVHIALGIGVASAPSVLNDFVENRLRGRMIAVMGLTNGVMGAGLGPMSTAFVSDYAFDEDIRMSLLTVIPVVCLIALLLALLVMRRFATVAYREPKNP